MRDCGPRNERRRTLVLAMLAAAPAACVYREPAPSGTPIQAPASAVLVRPPGVGQRWVYTVRNAFNGLSVDELTESIVATGAQVRIERESREHGPLAEEIQDPWGMLAQDPHWDPPVRYSRPLPAWPQGLEQRRSIGYRDSYRLVPSGDFDLAWNLEMIPREWESIRVAAGEFPALRFDNVIRFRSNDESVLESERRESVWFAPQIGRWVLRRSRGFYYVPGRGADRYEDFREWELLSWQ